VHRPFGEQLEDGRAYIAATATAATASSGTARSARAEAEAAARVEAELEAWAAAGPEAEAAVEAGARVLLAELLTHVVAEFAPGLTPLLVQCAPVEPSEAEAAGRRARMGWSYLFPSGGRKHRQRLHVVLR
jgi:hypothetical protein